MIDNEVWVVLGKPPSLVLVDRLFSFCLDKLEGSLMIPVVHVYEEHVEESPLLQCEEELETSQKRQRGVLLSFL